MLTFTNFTNSPFIILSFQQYFSISGNRTETTWWRYSILPPVSAEKARISRYHVRFYWNLFDPHSQKRVISLTGSFAVIHPKKNVEIAKWRNPSVSSKGKPTVFQSESTNTTWLPFQPAIKSYECYTCKLGCSHTEYRGHYMKPTQTSCTFIFGKSLKTTIYLHCLIPHKWGI